MATTTKKSYTDNFQTYINSCKESVRSERAEGYYHVDVVADAYSQGFLDGEKSGRQDIIEQLISEEVERFTQRANQIYILSKKLITFLSNDSFQVNGLYINLAPNRPSVIVAVATELLNADEFVEKAYSKLFDYKKIYEELFQENLDIGFVSNDNLDDKLLEEDGFRYIEKYDIE